MLVVRRFPLSLLSLMLVMLIAWKGVGFGADLPEKIREELDRGKNRLESEFNAAEETLLSSFDRKISNARSAPKLTGEEKQQLITSIEAEKSLFETIGHLPFSSVMRTETIEYLNKVQKAEIALAKIYDRAVEYHTKQKNDEAARALVAEKNQSIEPKVAAKWTTTDPNLKNRTDTLTLLSNGSVKGWVGRTWTLDQRQLVTRWKKKDAPGGAWVDTCELSADGMHFDAKNQNGYKYSADRLTSE